MFDVGSGELLLILVVALLLFGGRLPEVARSLGRSLGTLKQGFDDAMRPMREIDKPVADFKAQVRRGIEDGLPGND